MNHQTMTRIFASLCELTIRAQLSGTVDQYRARLRQYRRFAAMHGESCRLSISR